MTTTRNMPNSSPVNQYQNQQQQHQHQQLQQQQTSNQQQVGSYIAVYIFYIKSRKMTFHFSYHFFTIPALF